MAGVFLGVTGLFEACMLSYEAISQACQLEKTSATLQMKLRIQEARLLVWGKGWGISNGKVDEVFVPSSLASVVSGVLEQIRQLLSDSAKLKTKYGVVDTGTQPTSGGGSSIRSSNMLRLRANWVVADKGKFETLVGELRYFNDSLYDILPLPTQQYLLQSALPSTLLQTDDRSELEAIFTAAMGTYDELAQAANIRNLQAPGGPAVSFFGAVSTSSLKISKAELNLSSSNSACLSNDRDFATCRRLNTTARVLIEWRPFDRNSDEDAFHTLYDRIADLARLLHPSSRKPPGFRALDCIGFCPDWSRSRFGFVYDTTPNAAAPVTLFQLLQPGNPHLAPPPLGERFRLARLTAVALLQLHASGWLHKRVCSQNILFFLSSTDAASLEPFIAGFHYSRLDRLGEATEEVPANPQMDIYRHPGCFERGIGYRRAFDIYSLGLVLLEIGLWKPLRELYKERYTHQKFLERLEQYHFPALGFAVGRVYETVVRRCLGENFGSENDGGKVRQEDPRVVQDTFCWELVNRLQKCSA